MPVVTDMSNVMLCSVDGVDYVVVDVMMMMMVMVIVLRATRGRGVWSCS